MTAPTVASRTAFSVGSGTTHNVSMPATVAANDLLLMFFVTGAASGGITTPSGWSIIAAETAINSGGSSSIIYGKKAAGSEGGTTVNVVTANSVTAAAHTFRILAAEWNGTLATDVVAGTPVHAATNSNPDPPSASWTWGTTDVLAIAQVGFAASTSVTLNTYPSSYTNGLETIQASFQARIGTAYLGFTSKASPENPGTFALSGSLETVVNTVVVSGVRGASGTGAITTAHVTTSESGLQRFTATGSKTITPLTIAATGVVNRRVATGAISTAHLTVSGAGMIAPAVPVPATLVASAQQVEDALSGRYGGVPLRFRYTRRTRTNGFIDNINAVIDGGSITLHNSRPVVRDMSMTLDASLLPEDFNAAADIIGVAVEVYVAAVQQWVSIPCGLFILDVSETHYRHNNALLPVKGADLAMFLVRSVRTAAYTVMAGTNYVTAVEAIIGRHGLDHSIPATAFETPLDFTWPAGTTDYDITRDLLFGINYYPLWADATGIIRSRERIDPSTELPVVTYRNTEEPKMVSALDDYIRSLDRKPSNRITVTLDDPRHLDFGYVQRENVDTDAPNSTASLAYGDAAVISSSAAVSPTLITTSAAHGFSTGVQVLISGHSGSTPDINGSHVVTVISSTTFTIPISVSVGGTGGTVQATAVQLTEYKGDSDPATLAMVSATKAGEVAAFELEWAAIFAQQSGLATFIDPRREAREFYSLDIDGVEDSQLYAALGWSMSLKPGAIMQHSIGRAIPLEILSPPTS